MLRHTLVVAAAFIVGAGPASAQTLAQRLVRDMVAKHADVLSAMGVAVQSSKGCATVASTDPRDVGEKCDADRAAVVAVARDLPRELEARIPSRAKLVERSTR